MVMAKMNANRSTNRNSSERGGEEGGGCWNARSVDVDNWGVDASDWWEVNAVGNSGELAIGSLPTTPPAVDAFGVDRQTKGTSMHCPRRERMQVEYPSSATIGSRSRPILHSVKDDRHACRCSFNALLHNEFRSPQYIRSHASRFHA